jgi:tetratricopeptide (TPR) repeat protein
MLALAAAGITSLIMRVGHPWLRRGLVLVLVAGMIHPLRHVAVNHPNTYVYFNELLGGVNNAFGRFETDYYASSLGPASEQFLGKILPALGTAEETPVSVVSNSDISYYFRNHRDRVSTFYSRFYDMGKNDWDYAILYCNYIHPYQLNNGFWPPKNTIREIRVDDVVVAAIVKRENRDDYLGASLLQEGIREENPDKLREAVLHLERAVEYDSSNVAALLELGNAYSAFLRFEDARSTMDGLLEFYPEYDKALNLKGYSYLIESEVSGDPQLIDEAIRLINKAISSNYKFYYGYYNLGLCYTMKNDTDNAIYNYRQAIRYNSRFTPAYEKLAELYEFVGDMEMARTVRARLNSIRP